MHAKHTFIKWGQLLSGDSAELTIGGEWVRNQPAPLRIFAIPFRPTHFVSTFRRRHEKRNHSLSKIGIPCVVLLANNLSLLKHHQSRNQLPLESYQ